jgi:hypothetical protein
MRVTGENLASAGDQEISIFGTETIANSSSHVLLP